MNYSFCLGTWTPTYLNGIMNRSDYDNQGSNRLNRIYYRVSTLQCTKARDVTDRDENAEIKMDRDWLSFHWAVLVTSKW